MKSPWLGHMVLDIEKNAKLYLHNCFIRLVKFLAYSPKAFKLSFLLGMGYEAVLGI
jgi:hypothetical protein